MTGDMAHHLTCDTWYINIFKVLLGFFFAMVLLYAHAKIFRVSLIQDVKWMGPLGWLSRQGGGTSWWKLGCKQAWTLLICNIFCYNPDIPFCYVLSYSMVTYITLRSKNLNIYMLIHVCSLHNHMCLTGSSIRK